MRKLHIALLGAALSLAAGYVAANPPVVLHSGGVVANIGATPAAPMTWATGEGVGNSARFGGLTGNDVYDPIYPGVAHHDTTQATTHIANGSDIEHATALGGYVRNDSAVTNAVALFGLGMAATNGSKVWGINTLLQDAPTRTAGTGTGRFLINEFDFNVMNTGTQIIGNSFGGNSLAQPAHAIGTVVNRLSAANPAIKWNVAYWSMDGAAIYAFIAAPAEASGTNIRSQKVLLQAFNAAGAKINVEMTLDGAGFINFDGPISGIKFNGVTKVQ